MLVLSFSGDGLLVAKCNGVPKWLRRQMLEVDPLGGIDPSYAERRLGHYYLFLLRRASP